MSDSAKRDTKKHWVNAAWVAAAGSAVLVGAGLQYASLNPKNTGSSDARRGPQPFLPGVEKSDVEQRNINKFAQKLTPTVRSTLTNCVDAALSSDLYIHAKLHKPDEIDSALAALTGVCLLRNGSAGEKSETLDLVRKTFETVAGPTSKSALLVDKTISEMRSDKSILPSQSLEAAAFGVWNSASQWNLNILDGTPHPDQFPRLVPRDVAFILPAGNPTAREETFVVSEADVRNLAKLCYAESGSLGEPGQETCSKVVANRLAMGEGKNLTIVMVTGAFEAITKDVPNTLTGPARFQAIYQKLQELPATPKAAIDQTRAVIENRVDALKHDDATSYLNPKITKQRRSFFGTALTWIQTVGIASSWNSQALYTGRWQEDKGRRKDIYVHGTMRIEEVPPYKIIVAKPPASRPQSHRRKALLPRPTRQG